MRAVNLTVRNCKGLHPVGIETDYNAGAVVVANSCATFDNLLLHHNLGNRCSALMMLAGALQNGRTQMTIRNATIANNGPVYSVNPPLDLRPTAAIYCQTSTPLPVMTLLNSIVWGNEGCNVSNCGTGSCNCGTAGLRTVQETQIYDTSPDNGHVQNYEWLVIRNSCVEGLDPMGLLINRCGTIIDAPCFTETDPSTACGLLSDNPMFVDPDGSPPDFRLQASSTMINRARYSTTYPLPADYADIDRDGDFAEELPRDRGMMPRLMLPDPNLGILDIGCFEAEFCPEETCAADLDCSCGVDVDDMNALMAEWGPCVGCAGDLNSDQVVDVNDYLILVAQWGACGCSSGS